MEIPISLYKFQEINLQSLNNLKEQIIFFSSPLNFNDPYDCALFPKIEEPTDEEVERVREEFRNDTPTHITCNESVEEIKYKLIEASKRSINQYREKFLKNRGVTCFSEENDDLLMWSHYGNKYKGMCLEFNTRKWNIDKINKVKYQKSIPNISVIEFLFENKLKAPLIEKLFVTKSLSWEYEKEWRALHEMANHIYRYPGNALTGIYFGSETMDTHKEIVVDLFYKKNYRPKFYHGYRSKSEFKLKFKPIKIIEEE